MYKYGWITPTKRYVQCGVLMHIETAVDDRELRDLIPSIDELRRRVEEAHDQCEELAECGEHPEWHNYEIAYDDARSEIWDTLIQAGCIRIGTDYSDSLCAEGLSPALKDAYDKINELAEGRKIKFTPRT